MKHEFTSEELLRFADWHADMSGLAIGLRQDGGATISEYNYDANQYELVVVGPPDECAAFLINEWRKSRGES